MKYYVIERGVYPTYELSFTESRYTEFTIELADNEYLEYLRINTEFDQLQKFIQTKMEKE